MRLLFWGTNSPFSLLVLQALCSANNNPIAILQPDGGEGIRPISLPDKQAPTFLLPTTLAQMAAPYQIPVWGVGDLKQSDTLQRIASWQPTIACVACFPKRIPSPLLAIPQHGFINVHPSLLPAFRGPTPLFWQFRAGLTEMGVTIHQMDETFDTGDILQQETISIARGADGVQTEKRLAQVGGKLVVACLEAFHAGNLVPHPQPPTGHYQSFPKVKDFYLSTHWSADRAFHFMRGTNHWGHPYRVWVGEEWQLAQAIEVQPFRKLSTPMEVEGDSCRIQFDRGVLVAKIPP